MFVCKVMRLVSCQGWLKFTVLTFFMPCDRLQAHQNPWFGICLMIASGGAVNDYLSASTGHSPPPTTTFQRHCIGLPWSLGEVLLHRAAHRCFMAVTRSNGKHPHTPATGTCTSKNAALYVSLRNSRSGVLPIDPLKPNIRPGCHHLIQGAQAFKKLSGRY